MADKHIVLITGANTGIGYEAVKAYLRSSTPYHILLGSRTVEKAQNAIEAATKEVPDSKSTLEPVAIELESDESIAQALEAVKAKVDHIDTLVNNAGVYYTSQDCRRHKKADILQQALLLTLPTSTMTWTTSAPSSTRRTTSTSPAPMPSRPPLCLC